MQMDLKKGITPISVCFIAPKAYPLFNPVAEGVFGGSEVDLYYLATELARDERYAVSFVVADYGQAPTEVREGVRLLKSLDFQRNFLSGARRIWGALLRAEAAIYMLKTASPGAPLAAYFCRRRGRQFVYRTAHAYECDGTFMREHRWWGKAFAWSLRGAAAVFCQNSDDERNLRATLRISAQTIPNGHRIPPAQSSAREVILWVGRSAGFKRPELFVELARTRPSERFCMICPEATGDENYADLVRQARQVDNLEFITQVAFNEIDRYFQKAKVFVNTSAAEGFANTFIQAGKWGVPILSLEVNPDGFLDRYRCGRCAGGEWGSLVRMLDELLEPARGAEYGGNGRRYVEAHHDIEKIVEQYKVIFARLVGRDCRA